MASPENYISLQITLVQPGVSQEGFGIPLILSANAAFSERTREYTDLDGIADDGFATDSPEYRAAGAMFAQSPHVPTVKIGRLALPPTLEYTIAIGVLRDNHQYQVNVDGEGVTPTEVLAVATDGSASNDEAVALIVTALNLVAGNNYTASATGPGGSQVVSVVADNPGDWFSLEVDPDLVVSMTHSDPGYATDLAAILLEDPDWYVIYNPYNSADVIAEIAEWAEANKRGYWADTSDTESVTEAVGNGDPIDDLNTQGYKYSMGLYHPDPSEFFGAAWIGRYFCTVPGSSVPALKTLSGVAAVNLTATQRGNLTDKRGNSYERVFGRNVTFNGTVPSTDYLYFDVVRDVDKWANDVQTNGFGALASQEKIGFTDEDTPIVAAAIRGANKSAEDAKIAAKGSSFCTVPLVAAVSSTDKSNRFLSGIKAGFTLANAVQKIGVVATITF